MSGYPKASPAEDPLRNHRRTFRRTGFSAPAGCHPAVCCRFLLLILILAACNAAVPVETPQTTAETTSEDLPIIQAPTVTAARVTPDTPAVSVTPFIWPTLPPSPSPVCPGTPRARLIVGERGRVLPDDPLPVRLREAPGVDQHIVTLIPIRKLFLVLDGPVCVGSYTWFKVRYENQEGWIAEGTVKTDGGISYFVEPYFPG